MTGLIVVLAYALGAAIGVAGSRSARLAGVWQRVIRLQIVFVSVGVSILAAWRLEGLADLGWPLLAAAFTFVIMACAWWTTPRGSDRAGRAVLRGWSANANGGFWVIPVATAIAGAPGAVFAVIVDRLYIIIFGFFTWILRRNAPERQRMRTSWIDQAPVIALGIGLILNVTHETPEWTATALAWAAPLLALAGAAVFVGSVLHPSQRIAWRPGMRIWAGLSAVRVLLFVPAAFLAPTPEIAITFVLFGLTIPAFFPPQLSILYGYRDAVVAATARWGWVFAAPGVVLASILWSLG
jgi:energy-converting hydrogenase Eha subunit A